MRATVNTRASEVARLVELTRLVKELTGREPTRQELLDAIFAHGMAELRTSPQRLRFAKRVRAWSGAAPFD